MGRGGYCSFASASSMTESPIRTSACMMEPSGRGTRMPGVASKADKRNSINLGAPFTRKYGAILLKPGRRKWAALDDSGAGEVASFMVVLLCKSDFSAALKSGRGKSRNARAMGMSRTTAELGFGSVPGCRATSRASTARSSCTAGERLSMATLHLRAKGLECAELKLLDGAFGFLQAACDFADGALLDEALANDALLNPGQLVHETKNAGVAVD